VRDSGGEGGKKHRKVYSGEEAETKRQRERDAKRRDAKGRERGKEGKDNIRKVERERQEDMRREK
jgi:hypothetical protein